MEILETIDYAAQRGQEISKMQNGICQIVKRFKQITLRPQNQIPSCQNPAEQ